MAELVWSLNGKYFKDFGVGISSSDGILGELKPKKQDTKDWSEYNGVALDLTKKPKYEAREFTLSGWIVGADWLTMLNNFNALFGEFRNAGKQRLLLDVFGQKTLVFDVRCEDEIELKKTFKQGKMVGMFSLKLIEHNPIKKILCTANSNLQLAFNTPKWVEVNIDGKIDVYKGTVNINKILTSRAVTGYNFGGRNLLRNTAFKENINNWVSDDAPGSSVVWSSSEKALYLDNGNSMGSALQSIVLPAGDYVISFDVKPFYQNNGTGVRLKSDVGATSFINIHITNEYKRYTIMFSSQATTWVALSANGNQRLFFKNIKLEKGNKATDWTPAPEDQHFISIAGNIDEITALTTNADILWERL